MTIIGKMISIKLSTDKNEKCLEKLCEQYLQYKKELTQYKYMYRHETRVNKNLQKKLVKIQCESKILLKKYETLNERFMAMRQPVDPRPFTRKRKRWANIHCDCTKRQRISDYGNAVFKSIKKKIPHCQRAALSLYLGSGQQVNYLAT